MIDLDKIIESKFTIALLPYDVQLTIEDCMKEAMCQTLEEVNKRSDFMCEKSIMSIMEGME